MNIKCKKLHPEAQLPRRMTGGAGGYDLTATSLTVTVQAHDVQVLEYGLGLALEIPAGYVGLIFPRSSVYRQNLDMAYSVGVVDSDYRGEVKAIFRTVTPRFLREEFEYRPGDRVAQLVVVKAEELTPEWAEELTETVRGTGGYGSTGVR